MRDEENNQIHDFSTTTPEKYKQESDADESNAKPNDAKRKLGSAALRMFKLPIRFKVKDTQLSEARREHNLKRLEKDSRENSTETSPKRPAQGK